MTTFIGCGGSKSQPVSGGTDAKRQGQETDAEKCRKRLSAAIRRFEPESFSLQSNPERTVNGLNSWIKSCGADEMRGMKLDDSALQMLDANAQRLASAGIYTASDAAYIRDCWVLRELTRSIVERTDAAGVSDTDRTEAHVVAIFDWIVRNISLQPLDQERVPLGLFDVLLTGHGSAEDRAWVFAEALRQQQIDAVVVTTDSEPTDGGRLDSAQWIMAVILEDSGLLFDVISGLPVTDGEADDLQNPKPAGLLTLKGHQRWKDSSVLLVAQAAVFAPRMLLLQKQLAASDAAVLYEELTGGVSEIRPLVDRIVAASGDVWSNDSVAVWDYPEQRTIASLSLSEAQQQQYFRLMRPFNAPFERTEYTAESTEEMTTVPEALPPEERRRLVQERLMKDFSRMMESSEDMFGKPSRRLLKGRIQQIMGGIDIGVIQQLQQIRIASMRDSLRVRVPDEVQKEYGFPAVVAFPFPELIREVNQSSMGDAMYWTAMCQFDRREVGAAITTLVNYRRQYPEDRWRFPSLANQALALLVQERHEDARRILESADVEENPERVRIKAILAAIPTP
ncbi:MAG: hypothetical protein GY903_30405 [Fuerstiella sp.]|nr:hypothetical protein [Fuerstiella sp.]MCP4858807.1 hypothetical protein [Fuerstiella sp.]